MRSYINFLVVVFAISYGSLVLCSLHLEDTQYSDDYIVNDIKNRSNLTMKDVTRIKFLWLGFLTEPLKYAASIYAGTFFGAEGYMQTQQYPELVKNTSSYIPVDYQPEESTVNSIQQWLPLGVGVLGMGLGGYAVYRLLYPRIHSGILDMIQKYADVCRPLVVANNKFISLAEMSEDINDPEKGNPEWRIPNTIARCNAMKNLVEQASAATQLCKLLGEGVIDKEQVCKDVNKYEVNLQHNLGLILPVCRAIEQTEMKKNADAKAAKKVENLADINLNKEKIQVGVMKAGKRWLDWTFIKDVVFTGSKAMSFMWNNKYQIIATGLTLGIIGHATKDRFADYLSTYNTNLAGVLLSK